ncbi:MAG: nucleotidyl transferase AbiEii/AbiGii toxin family protein [Thermomicrobiales bacterium]
MRYATATAFRAALEQRLNTAARQDQRALGRLRKMVVFDRLLARLLVVAPDRWIVKGGLALDLRLGDRARTTRDLDLARQDSEEAATTDLIAAQSLDLGDFFTFEIERQGKMDPDLEGAAVRYHVTAGLDGRRFEDAIIDVGFGDPLVGTPDRLHGPDFFGFAGFEPIEVPALPLEQHLAEKVHAYTRTFGGQHPSSRVKDLIDLVLIRSAADFEAGRLRHALDVTFTARGTHAIPAALPSPPSSWATVYRRLATEVGLEPDLATGHRLAADFLDPVLSGEPEDDARWHAVRGSWRPSQ